MVIKVYQPGITPGLFQTRRYARSVIESYHPGRSPEELTDFLNVRMQRQQFWLERDDPARVIAIVGESTFHRSIGSLDIQLEQIKHLIQLSMKPFCSIRIYPFSAGVHSGDESNFVIFEEANGECSVNLELLAEGMKILKNKSYVEKYNNSFDQLLLRCLSEGDSRDFLSRFAGSLSS